MSFLAAVKQFFYRSYPQPRRYRCSIHSDATAMWLANPSASGNGYQLTKPICQQCYIDWVNSQFPDLAELDDAP